MLTLGTAGFKRGQEAEARTESGPGHGAGRPGLRVQARHGTARIAPGSGTSVSLPRHRLWTAQCGLLVPLPFWNQPSPILALASCNTSQPEDTNENGSRERGEEGTQKTRTAGTRQGCPASRYGGMEGQEGQKEDESDGHQPAESRRGEKPSASREATGTHGSSAAPCEERPPAAGGSGGARRGDSPPVPSTGTGSRSPLPALTQCRRRSRTAAGSSPCCGTGSAGPTPPSGRPPAPPARAPCGRARSGRRQRRPPRLRRRPRPGRHVGSGPCRRRAVREKPVRGCVCGGGPCSGLGDGPGTAQSMWLGRSSDVLESSLPPSTSRARPVFSKIPPGMVDPPPAWIAHSELNSHSPKWTSLNTVLSTNPNQPLNTVKKITPAKANTFHSLFHTTDIVPSSHTHSPCENTPSPMSTRTPDGFHELKIFLS